MIKFSVDRPGRRVPARCYDGWLEVTGWAAGDHPVVDISLRLGSSDWVRAVHGGVRPDVEAAHPRLVHAGRSGFRAYVPMPLQSTASKLEIVLSTSREKRSLDVPCHFETRHIALGDMPPVACRWCGVSGRTVATGQSHGPFLVFQCDACDYAFAGPWPSAADLASVYAIEYWDQSPTGADVVGISRDTAFVHDVITRHGNGGQSVLEVGCGQGTLLHGLHRLGMRVAGQDLATNAARTLEKKLGIPIWRGPLADAPPNRYDAIVSRHVLEHSVTPRADVAWMLGHLAPGGVLILITPNWRSLAAELLGVAWEWFVPPIHLSYFSPRSIRHLQDAFGLQLLDLHTRDGDAAPLGETLQTQIDYAAQAMSEVTRQRMQAAIRANQEAIPVDRAERTHLIGQELIAILKPATAARP